MGKIQRPKPARLAEKLLQIRLSLGLSQNGMIRHLGLVDELLQASISGYELGTREPPLPILLKYAQAAGVCTDTLIDDLVELPARLPSRERHGSHDRNRSRK
jgi:transcriptional regulator with XRE-family HTH domain